RRDAIAAYEQAGRSDLAAKERAEAEVLQAYLPARLDAQAVAAAVQTIVARVAEELGRRPGAADMGKVMAAAKAELAGRAEMAQVSAAVKAALAG
ncbi:MAG: GatB/YqeY domain-containing protein, partial [Tepidimonas sp.]|nr:GatB/YqeY domain-containing protein [Tepidimonas sp.]